MTTIIVKNADFSGGALSTYKPPVDGALLAAFVDDEDIDSAILNFGSGSDLTVPDAIPDVSAVAGFRDFSNADGQYFLAPDVFRVAGAMTLMAVIHSAAPTSETWNIPLSTEHTPTSGIGTRRGIALVKVFNLATARLQTDVPTGTGFTTVTRDVAISAGGVCMIGTFNASSHMNIHNLTSGSSSGIVTGIPAEGVYNVEESDKPFYVGRNPLGNAGAGLAGFVGVWPFEMTAAQRTAMYESVKRRFTSLGVTI